MKFSLIAAAIGGALGFSSADAATLNFVLDDQQGSASLETSVMLEDVTGGVKFTYSVSDAANTGDIIAVYMDFGTSVPGDLQVDGNSIPLAAGTYAGSVVTEAALNTSNVQSGNIGQTFDLGLQIGQPGSSSDFFNNFMFTLTGTGLDVGDFAGQTFAIRGQTVGPCSSPGPGSCPDGDSAKNFGTAPMPSPVPLPAGGLLLLGGLSAFGLVARRRRKA